MTLSWLKSSYYMNTEFYLLMKSTDQNWACLVFFNKCEIYNWKSENKPCFQSQCNFRKFTDFLFTYNLWIFGPQNAHKQLICDKEHMIIEFYRFYECRSHQVAL